MQAIELLNSKGIMIDLSLYQQILYNIFINAWKFNHMGGKIKLSVFVNSVMGERRKLKMTTEIEDNGEGMDKLQLKKLFKIFENIRKNEFKRSESESNASERNVTSGCGLGLHLSYQLAKFLDGDIQVNSQVQQGTSVKVILLVDIGK